MKRLIIAIDGPSGSGKSTIGKLLARALGYVYVDSGAMYRAVAFKVLENKFSIDDIDQVVALASQLKMDFVQDQTGQRLFVNGEDLTEQIRTPEVAQAASKLSAIPGVRRILVRRQREICSGGGIVMDGRDIGTVVFPNADLKIYLDASVDERAHRRNLEDQVRGLPADLTATVREIRERDRRDMSRQDSPLRKAEDAYYLDTSRITIREVFDEIMAKIAERGGDVHRNR